MSESLLSRGFKILQQGGAAELLRKSVWFTYSSIFNRLFSVQNDNINKLSTQKTQIGTPTRVLITYNRDSNSVLPDLLLRVQGEIVEPEREILEFNSAKLLDDPPFVNVGLKNFYIDSVGNSRKTFSPRKHSPQDTIFSRSGVDKQLDFAFVVGGSRGMGGFAGWFYEQLPKLYWYERYCEKTDSNPELILSGKLSGINIRSLELLGYPPDNYIHHQGTQVIGIDRLVLPPHPLRTRSGEFQVCPSAIQWVRDRIISNLPSNSTSFPDRVYVSRADADRRQVINENEVISLLKQYGFESFEPGRLSFDDQVRLFANADVIVGPHGAGLTNMIYGENVKILELMTEESGEHFFVLANECDHFYEFLLCEPANDESIKPRYRDMSVDLHSLEDRLNFLLDDSQ